MCNVYMESNLVLETEAQKFLNMKKNVLKPTPYLPKKDLQMKISMLNLELELLLKRKNHTTLDIVHRLVPWT